MKGKDSRVYLVIPAFNEEKRVGKIVKSLLSFRYPVIVVDDGSTDSTGKKSLDAGATVLRHKINLGNSKGAAMKTGCEYAFSRGASAVVFLDADGQHLAKDLPKFTEKISQGYEVVFGKRNFNNKTPFIRLLGNKIVSYLIKYIFNSKVTDILCGYRALTKKAYQKIRWDSYDYAVETEMVIRTTKKRLKYCEVEVETIYLDREKGVSVFEALNVFMNLIIWSFKI